MNLYIFHLVKEPLQQEMEVVIEKFEYLPDRSAKLIWPCQWIWILAVCVLRELGNASGANKGSRNTYGTMGRRTGIPRRARLCHRANPDGYLWIGAERD